MAGEKSEGVKLYTYSLLTQTGSSLVRQLNRITEPPLHNFSYIISKS